MSSLKVIIVKNIYFFTYGHWITGLNLEIAFVMVLIIWWCCVLIFLNILDILVIFVKGVDYSFIIYNIAKSEAIHLLKSSLIEDRVYI